MGFATSLIAAPPPLLGGPASRADTVESRIALEALDVTSRDASVPVLLLGQREPGDGGGGWFMLDKSGTLGVNAADGGIILVARGRDDWYWRRIREGTSVDMRWYGVRLDGSEDCAPAVRRAARWGDVYFPAGVYLLSHVDVASGRRYFGDGPGRSIIKRASSGGHDRIIFGVATVDFERSGHPAGDIEHVRIEDLTLDFNLVTGWVNRPLIQFRGDADHVIRDVTIQRIEFIDSSRVPHPVASGKRGGDAWGINVSAPNVERLTVRDCVSYAEGHQFIAGGGSMRGVRYLDNEVHAGWANGISMTTVGPVARFEDVEISGNRFYSTASASIYLGYDFGYERPIGEMDFRDIRICNNLFVQESPCIYGRMPKEPSYPTAVQVIAGYSGVQNLLITGNTMRVAADYWGGDVNFLKFDRGDFQMPPGKIEVEFTQPESGSSAAVRISPAEHMQKPWALPGCVLAVKGGGFYRVQSQSGADLSLVPLEWPVGAKAGTSISAGARVENLGGIWSQILVSNNNAGQRYLIGNSFFHDLTISGNVVGNAVRLNNSQVAALNVTGNSDLTFDSAEGNLVGRIAGNTLRAVRTFGYGALNLNVSRDSRTGFDETCALIIADNVLVSGQAGSPNDVGLRIDGDAKRADIRLWNNVFTSSSAEGMTGTLLSPERGIRVWGNAYQGGPESGGRIFSARSTTGSAEFSFSGRGGEEIVRNVAVPGAAMGDQIAIGTVDGPDSAAFHFHAAVVGVGVVKVRAAAPDGEALPATRRFQFQFLLW